MLGPKLDSNQQMISSEVEVMDTSLPQENCSLQALVDTVNSMRERGCDITVGNWLIEGQPFVVL